MTVTLNPSLDRTLNVAQLMFDDMVRATHSRLESSGKGINVSRSLHALGVANTALGFVAGAAGRTLADGIASFGIASELIEVSGETRTNTRIEDAATGRYIKVNESGPSVSESNIAVLFERVAALARPGSWWVLAGSLPSGAPDDVYARLIELVQTRGGYAILDASGESLRLGCAARPFAVKPNIDEAAALCGFPLDSQPAQLRAAAGMLRLGVQTVALSLGADGLLLATTQAAVRAIPPRVPVHNPVGAGDALVAGLVWALTQQNKPEDVARWAVAAGTSAARGGGTIPSHEDMAQVYQQVKVHVLPMPPADESFTAGAG